jgi:hypothetical protein
MQDFFKLFYDTPSGIILQLYINLLCYDVSMEKDIDSNLHEKDDEKHKESTKSMKSSFVGNKSENSAEKDNIANHETEQKPSNIAKFFTKGIVEEKTVSSKDYIDNNEEKDENTNLSEEEVHEATLAIVDGRTQNIAEELSSSEPDSAEEFEALAGAVFLEYLQDLVENDNDVTLETIKQAFQESLEDLSMSDRGDTEDIRQTEPENHGTQENTSNAVRSSIIPTSLPYNNSAASFSPRPLVVQSQIPPSVPLASLSSSSMNHKANLNSHDDHNFSVANQNTPPVIVNEVYNYRNNLLLGAVIGYMVGRRGGRKRTEKKLHPKIDNLQKQVTILHEAILEKETKIRSLARVNIANSNTQTVETAVIIERRKKRKEVKESLRRREVLSKKPGVEKIGKFSLPALKVFHERRLPDGTENSPKRKQVEIMNEAELLDMVAGLSIHGLSIADIYRRKRLTLESLRQITKEYLRGGPYKQTFSLELLPDEKEILEIRQVVHEAHNSSSQPQFKTPNMHPNQGVDASNKPRSTAEKKTHTSVMSDNKKNSVPSGVVTGIILAAIATVIYLIS